MYLLLQAQALGLALTRVVAVRADFYTLIADN
jgi:hypothetical protein